MVRNQKYSNLQKYTTNKRKNLPILLFLNWSRQGTFQMCLRNKTGHFAVNITAHIASLSIAKWLNRLISCELQQQRAYHPPHFQLDYWNATISTHRSRSATWVMRRILAETIPLFVIADNINNILKEFYNNKILRAAVSRFGCV